ncbi:helix-turn-helix domain-containing protein [Carboxylicivirga linearis]|uniref:Helix-turn-helix transcriptional regulator n=1 Tax=Carboxylicivirga linearis TaxID=1628157 RepID=A0ABS5K052_9BACT|nr:response regulator transcription factor [Carboxylicivirga linearis]MBS2100506.1 helix-turn-helix transcriptional regulator [Carboxylicivirga linearis]
MKTQDPLYIKIKEGDIQTYLRAFEESFKAEVKDKRLIYKRGNSEWKITAYSYFPEFEFMVVQGNYDYNIVIDRTPDEIPDYYHINIVKEGKVVQDYNNEQQLMEAGSPQGIFIYNGLFPLKSEFHANHQHQSVSFKLYRKGLQELMPEAVDIFDKLFENDEAKGYHLHLTTEMDRLLFDLLHYDNSDSGRILLVHAKAFELFTTLMQSVQKLLNKDELHGLHVDDYNRLMIIKDKVIQSVESKINLEDLANEFAVSVSKLQRDFKALFNCSVYQFYTHAKMDEAYRRLKTGQYTVMEVGFDMGYNSVSKFSLMFKKVKGVNPKEVIPG